MQHAGHKVSRQQERGIGRALLAKTMEQFDSWGTPHVGLFTFAHSAKHVALYQKYGFYPRFLTAIMSGPAAPRQSAGWLRFGELSEAQRNEAPRLCREVTETLCSGWARTRRHAPLAAREIGVKCNPELPTGRAEVL